MMTVFRPLVRACPPRPREAQAGFTLLEILLALAIMGMLTVTLASTFSQSSRIKRNVEAAQDRTHSARVALMRMTREIEMAFLSASENMAIQERRTMFVATSRPAVDDIMFSWFGRQRLRMDAAEADTSMVRYYAAPDPNDPLVTNLMRRESKRLEQKSPETLMGEAYILCPAVVSVKFSFYDFRSKNWREDWTTIGSDGRQYLPTHVRIWLTIYDEKGREVVFSSAARIQMTERVDYRPRRA
jgi:general secretion pathway protein J